MTTLRTAIIAGTSLTGVPMTVLAAHLAEHNHQGTSLLAATAATVLFSVAVNLLTNTTRS